MPAYKSSIFDLLTTRNLVIPDYQRPYKWTKRNVEELLSDISKAIDERQKYGDSYKYRIGTILIHDSKDGLNIVDGQQRLISAALICLCLDQSFRSELANHNFSDDISKQNIRDNYMFIQQWFTLKNSAEKKLFLDALKNTIEVIVITVHELSEAFQLFDSQNTRGKTLYPHDLLKAYHLREMNSVLSEMEHAVRKWEDKKPSEIKELFSDYIYPIYNWSRMRKTDIFKERSIEVFKGADIKESYTYALRAFKSSPVFQINEPFIAGNDFFEYVDHYIQMLRDIKKRLEEDKEFSEIQKILRCRESGLKYCKTLFYCALICYYDRFHRFDKMAVLRLFTWAFMIRIDMQHLGYDTINKYAIGEHNGQYSNNLPIFSLIADSRKHSDVANLTIICRYKGENWKELAEYLLKLNGLYRNEK